MVDYLRRLNELRGNEQNKENKEKETKRKKDFRSAREIYRKVAQSEINQFGVGKVSLRKLMELDEKSAYENRAEILAVAHKLLDPKSFQIPNPSALLTGAKLYEKIGKGKRAIPRLISGLEKAYQQEDEVYKTYEDIGSLSRYMNEAKMFVERNSGESQNKSLETRVGVFVASIFGGLVLSISSLTLTGNAISNLVGTDRGLIGLILFAFGVVGLVFSKK